MEGFSSFSRRVLNGKIILINVDGWAKSDVEYIWKENPVQLAGNLSLPGGFKLGAFGSENCDVVTSTGKTSSNL